MHPTSGGAGAVCGRPPVLGYPAGIPEPDSGAGPAIQAEAGLSSSGAARWPVRSRLELGAYPSAVPCARGHARLVVAEWGLPERASAVELVVSELVTNGLRASAGLSGSRFEGKWTPGMPPVRLWLGSDFRDVLVQVWDGNDRMPERAAIDLDSESGRGLWLVEATSRAWGAYVPDGASGKVVWACVATHGRSRGLRVP